MLPRPPCGPVGKNLLANAGDARDKGWILGLERDSWGWNGNPLQYSCLANSMDRGSWQAAVHGVTKSRTWLSTQHITNDAACYRQSLGLVLILLSCCMWRKQVSWWGLLCRLTLDQPCPHALKAPWANFSLTLIMLSDHYQRGGSVSYTRG